MNRRFGALRFFHHADNLRQSGFRAHARGLKLKTAVFINSDAEHHIARVFFRGNAFAGEHGFVHGRVAFNDFPVNRNFFARPDDYDIAFNYFINGDVLNRAIAADPRGFGLKPHKFFYGVRSFSFGSNLQPFAQDNEGY